ncbi:hypothetical protein [Luteolibacter sp. Populi]|uniref:hypothetical protein n=1 Tax=Luteolibacter sp. Populi TaxID=3230487 RepID=UPI0034651859
MVVSLSLMVLLTILAVGLLTLSSVSLRSAGQSEAMQVARGNARLALSMAIGQLQKHAGADQKITAPATIAKEGAPSWLAGTWNGKLATAATPVPAKDKEFQGYLISGSEEGSPGIPSELPDTTDNADRAELMGKGSLGKSPAPADIVRAEKIKTSGGGKGYDGRYAWAVLDEGVKTKVDVVREDRSDSKKLGKAANQAATGAPSRSGVEIMDGFESYDWFKGTDQKKLYTLPTGDLINKMPELAEHQHEITTVSRGLVTDAARGGLRKDLSLLFSKTVLPRDYSNRRVYDDPVAVTEVSNPYWGQIHEYANLYSKVTDSLKASVPQNYVTIKYDPRARVNKVSPQANQNMILMPVVAKVQMQFSLVCKDAHGVWEPGVDGDLATKEDNYMIYMIYSPIVTLYNPYSVPLTFDELRIDFKDLPIGFRFYRNGQPQTTQLAHFNQLYVNHPSNSTVAKSFGLNIRSAYSKTKVAAVTMQPGENRVFGESISGDLSWNSGSTSFFDYNDSDGKGMTADLPLAPGYPSQGIGYWIDWLTPQHIKSGFDDNRGIFPVKLSDMIDVGFAPMKSESQTGPRLSVEIQLLQGNVKRRCGSLDLDYVDDSTLRKALSRTSSGFANGGEERLERPYRGDEMYQSPGDKLKDFTRCKAFAQFSFYAKTTLDSDTPTKPWVQGGQTTSLVGIDLAKEPMGVHPFEVSLKRLAPGYKFPLDAFNRGKFFTGVSDANGTRIAPQYEIPQLPMESLAQLRHAQLSNQGFLPGASYTVGESYASSMIPAGSVAISGTKDYKLLDHAWLANTALWDSYYFSTLSPYAGPLLDGRSVEGVAQKFFGGEEPLLNPRFIATGNSSTEETVGALMEENGYLASAAHLMIDGAFNVNSTSVNAWAALLASLNQQDIDFSSLVDGQATPMKGTEANASFPFTRMRRAAGPAVEKANGVQGRHARWTGMRTLQEQQIQQLAVNIVQEVKARGPFLSLAEFVNRRPGSDKNQAREGALQTAIDKTDINTRFDADSKTYTTADLGPEGYAFPEAMAGMNAAGAPGYLTQGDILSAVGSVVAVRSDTFRVRSYGEALDTNDKVIARAWCEAVVQRVPDFIDASNAPETATESLKEINQYFGRRFMVTGFRWLGKDEV